MKSKVARTGLLSIFAATFIAGMASPAHAAGPSCSLARASGKWGFTLTGTLILPTGPVPGAAIGRLSVDAKGNISGTEARNVGGGFATETIAGSWTVNSDCTSLITANIYESGSLVRTSVLAGVFVDDSRKIRAVQESLALPDGTPVPVVITLDGNKLFETGDD